MKKYYTRNQISTYKNFRKNVIFGRKGLANTLDKRIEQKEFHEALKKYQKGGIDSHEMRSVIGSFYQNTNDHIDRGEAIKLAKEFIGGSRYMLRPGRDRRYISSRQGGVSAYNARRNGASDLKTDTINQIKPVSKPRKAIGYSGMRLVN